MSQRFDKPLPVGETDTYSYGVPTRWLNGEAIVSHSVTVDVGLQFNSSGVNGRYIGVSLTGISTGLVTVHFHWVTESGRTDCKSLFILVRDNCF